MSSGGYSSVQIVHLLQYMSEHACKGEPHIEYSSGAKWSHNTDRHNGKNLYYCTSYQTDRLCKSPTKKITDKPPLITNMAVLNCNFFGAFKFK